MIVIPIKKIETIKLTDLKVSPDDVPIDQKKKMSSIIRQGEAMAKQDACLICKESGGGFCNSHTIPKFVLKNISADGFVLDPSIFMGERLDNARKGINRANVFRTICRKCDSRYFQAYENPMNYSSSISGEIISQIALKNFLSRLSNRYRSRGLSDAVNEHQRFPLFDSGNKGCMRELDIIDFERQLQYAKRAVDKS